MCESVREPVEGANRCGRHAEWTSEHPDRDGSDCGSLCRAERVGFGGKPTRYPWARYRQRISVHAFSGARQGDVAPYRKSEFAAGQTNLRWHRGLSVLLYRDGRLFFVFAGGRKPKESIAPEERERTWSRMSDGWWQTQLTAATSRKDRTSGTFICETWFDGRGIFKWRDFDD